MCAREQRLLQRDAQASFVNSATIVQELWNCCDVLHDDGMCYGDDLVQLTYLLFCSIGDERIPPSISNGVDHATRFLPCL